MKIIGFSGWLIDSIRKSEENRLVSDLIFPRSPREIMAGWVWLPRFVDKIRLHIAGRLHADYQPNFCVKGFDKAWLDAAGVEGESFIEAVRKTNTDGEVCDWVRVHASDDAATRAAFRDKMENYGRDESDTELRALLQQRKEDNGLADREDIQCFVDFIDADEQRL